MALESFEIIRVLILAAVSFAVALVWAPLLIRAVKKWHLGKSIRTKERAPVFSSLHAKKAGTPTMGGILVWGTVLLMAGGFFLAAHLSPDSLLGRLNFLSRSETWLPMAALIASALVGLIDDYFNCKRIGPNGGGLRVRHRLIIYTAIAGAGAWWFAVKLGWNFLHIPFLGGFIIGPWYVPFFILVLVATAFSVNEADGLDGLASGTLMTSFGAFAIIAFAQGKYDLAVFCGAVLGALLAFLWHNIYPARIFLGDTGAMSLGITLGIVAMLTNSALFLPVIGLVFVLESLSVLAQIAFRKLFGRRLFLSAPFHHHLEALGWHESTIVMRLWMISMVAGALGAALALIDALIK